MALLAGINLFASPENIWFIWPLIGWGLAVALQGLRVFFLADKDMIIDAMTKDELRRTGVDTRDDGK